ncbi:RYR1, partial [Symbiodinium sp. CCMP2456]
MAAPPGRERRVEAVYRLLQTCQEASTFAAAAELVTNILNWEPPLGEKGVEDSIRLELIKNLIAPPIDPVDQVVDKARLEDRAPHVTQRLMTSVEIRRNVELMADPKANAVETFFMYLSCSQSLTVTRTLELLIRLVSRSTSEIRRTWAEDMCQSHHFKRLMEMVMQQGDRRVRGLYETLLGFVLKQCDQTRLMETVTSYSEDEISAEERFYIGKILYGCLSCVKSMQETRPLLAPALADAMKPEHAQGVSRIRKLQIQGAPGIAVECIPLPPLVGNVRTQVKLWQPDKEQLYPVCKNPNEIYIWISHSESELDQPVERREVPPCVVVMCHTQPMPKRGEEMREEVTQRYEGTTADKILCKSLDFADSIYYQVQFMGGRAIQPFVEQEDAELLQDEPPRVVLKLLCTNMVMKDMTEQKVKLNCNAAFAIIPNRSQTVAEFIFKQVEDIEEELLQELAQAKGEQDTEEGANDEVAEGMALPEEMVILQQDPSKTVMYQEDVLRWARTARIARKSLEGIGDGSVVNGGQDIDASKDDNAEAAAAAALRGSSSYGRVAEKLRPIQRFFALCLVAMTKASLSRMSDARQRLIELMDSLDSYTAQAICEAILELLTMPKNIGLFSKSSIDKTLMSMEQTFQQPESAERSLIAFADILWKYLKPDSRLAEDGLKASVRIVRPLLELLSRPDTSKEQKSKIFTIIRQGMRFSIISTDTFTQGVMSKGTGSGKDKHGASTMHQVLRPMDSSLEAVGQEDARDTGELFFDLNLCFSAASVLKYICCTTSPEEHSQLIQLEVVPKMMRILSVIRDFLPRFANSKANFNYDIPGFCTNPQTNTLYKSVYRLLPYTASTRLFREICGSISNCCQCLSNLMQDQFPTTNCIPLIQMLAFDEGDGLRDLYDMLRNVEVDIGINDQSLLADLHPDITLMVESLRAITMNCNRKMRSRVLEVMYTALHPYGPVLPKINSKKQDIKELNHDYRILTYLKNSGAEADEKREHFFLPSRSERAFSFSVWSRMDKGISTQIRIEWDCSSSSESTLDLKRMVEQGKDVLPIDASFRIVRKQQDDHLRLRYEEVRELRNANMQKRRRVWNWTDKGGADMPPRPLKDMKELKEQKGWAFLSFIMEIEEEDRNKRVSSDKAEDAIEEAGGLTDAAAREKAAGDTRAVAHLQVFYGLAKSAKPARPRALEISKPHYEYQVQDQNIIGASHFTLTTSSLGEGTPLGNAAAGATSSAAGNQSFNGSSPRAATSARSRPESVAGSIKGTEVSQAVSAATSNNVTKGLNNQTAPPLLDEDFVRIQLESFLPLLMPFKTNSAANAGLLTISPYEVNTPERREAARRAIMMPDVFLSRDLVPELVPCCQVATTTDLLSTLSAHTLYLLTMAFARPEPADSAEEADCTIKLGQFQQVLEQFRKRCTNGTAEENLGGIRVIVDVLWKLFTRRRTVVSEEEYKEFAQNKDSLQKDPYYWVKFVQRILELLTDLCIGPDGSAINEIQDFITRELIQTSEAISIRRRPAPECWDNVWAKTRITVDDHLQARAEIERRSGFVGSGKGLRQLMSQKDEFTLLKLGTSIFFDNFESALEEVQAPEAEDEEDLAQQVRNMVPRVLWMQQRAQPPRYEGRGYFRDDLEFHQPNQMIQPCRFLYFALVNLLAHLTADRNMDNSQLLQGVIPPSVVRGQLIQREVLRNAGLVFCPSHLAERRRQQGQINESRDAADLSDLAALSSHTALLLHAFLGQPPFADESVRSSVITQVYLDGTRADDDDSAFEELPGGGSAPLTPMDLQRLCHMCSWQFASLAELCRDMASPGLPPPRTDFSDCMGHLVSVLSMLLSKLIGLGYFERFRMEAEQRRQERQERLDRGLQINDDDRDDGSVQSYQIRWVTELFSAMHRLLQVHKSLATDLYLAALKDLCRLLNMCCSLCVNTHVTSFMETFREFLPQSVKDMALGIQRPPHLQSNSLEANRGKHISVEAIEEVPSYVVIVSDLAQVALPWQPPDSGDRACRQALSSFVQVLLDFMAMNDSALAIAAVMLLSRLCRRRKDFLETIQRLQLLYVGDEPKFEALEPWVQEANRQLDLVHKVGKDFEDVMDYVRDSNMEVYTIGFADSIEWSEDDLGDRKTVEKQPQDSRTIEYTDKHQASGVVVRLSQSSMALIDGKVVNVDFYIKSVCKTGEEDENEGEDALLAPIYVGAISSKYVGEDNRLTGDRRAQAAEGFFGCDEFGHLYISGHRIEDKFGGFKKGSTVGVEIDYSDEAKRAMFIVVDGFRVGAIRREVDEGMVPCIILNGMGQVVRVNVGRPRRGKGLLVKREDTIQEEWQSLYKDHAEPDTTVLHLVYQVGKEPVHSAFGSFLPT